MTRRGIIIIGTALAALLAVGAALAIAGSPGPARKHSNAHPSKHVALTHTVDSRIRHKLRIFRSASEASVASMNQGLEHMLNNKVAPLNGANVQLARGTDTPTGPMYLVPGQDVICQAGGAGGVGCADVSTLGQDPRGYVLFGHSEGNPRNTVGVSGIAADDVTSIDAVLADGTTISVPVSDNAFSSYIPTDATKLEYHTTDHGTFVGSIGEAPAPPTD